MTSSPVSAHLFCLLLAGPLLSKNLVADEVDIFQLSLAELLKIEVEVATKTKGRLDQAPSSVTVFTRQQLLNMGLTQIEQVLNFVPGFDAPRELFLGQGAAVTPRGRRSDQNAKDVLFLLDGQRINGDTTGGALQVNRYLSLGNIKQIEVIRGPGSALYGSNAFLGVVNLITDKQLNETQLSLTHEGQTVFNGSYSKAGGDWNSSVSIHATHDRGTDYTINHSQTDDPWHQVQLDWSLESEKLTLSGRYQRQELENFYLFGSLANDINDYDSSSGFARAVYTIINSNPLKLSAYTSYHGSRSNGLIQVFDAEFMTSLKTQGITEGGDAFLAGFDTRNSEINLGIDSTYKANSRHTISSGVELRHAKLFWLKNINNYELVDFIDVLVLNNSGTIAYYNELTETSSALIPQSRNIYSAYLQDDYRWNSRWHTTAGVRVDDYSDFGSTINPRAAIHFSPQPNLQVKLMYGEAFRAPSINETGIQNSPVEIGNPNLQPETVTTWELNTQFNQADSQWQFTYFHNSIEDAIEQSPINSDPRTTPSNTDEITTEGLELEFSKQLSAALQLRTNMTHYRHIASDEKSTPAQMGSIVLNYQQTDYNINLNAYYRSETEQMLNNNEPLSSYSLLNLHTRLRIHPQLELNLGVSNLTNRNARSVSFNTPLPGGTPYRGRTFSIGLRWQGG